MSVRIWLASAVCLFWLGCPGGSGETAAEPALDSAANRFEGARAFADLRDLVAIGERPAGSAGAARTRELIRERLRQAGWVSATQAFQVDAGSGASVAMENIVAKRPGRQSTIILLGAHYDTKRIEGMRFLGANDGASGVAVLLELARVLGPGPGEFPVWLAFFDGEEAFGADITREDGLFGSRALAERMLRDGALERIGAVIVVDMVGDRDLDLVSDSHSSPRLRSYLNQAAVRIGHPEVLGNGPRLAIVDDHLPFRERGVAEVLLLMDFQFGGRSVPGPYWHTPRDDLASVSAESLNTAGKLCVLVLERIERFIAEESAPGR
ncbi:MAG: M28 family peptidase [Myxococcales bacterium]|nr:M28 family peptidase [Myxococcales bacterium]